MLCAQLHVAATTAAAAATLWSGVFPYSTDQDTGESPVKSAADRLAAVADSSAMASQPSAAPSMQTLAGTSRGMLRPQVCAVVLPNLSLQL